MNPELHHKWNERRDPFYGDPHREQVEPKANQQENKVTLKQNGVRTPR